MKIYIISLVSIALAITIGLAYLVIGNPVGVGGPTDVVVGNKITDSEKGEATKDKLQQEFLEKRKMTETNTMTIVKSLGQAHEIDGGIWFNTSVAIPPCDETTRGLLWFLTSKSGAADSLSLCMKDTNDNFLWVSITP